MEDSVFTKIIRRDIPANIVYEDDDTIAFLDARPNVPGHTLVVPKKQVRNIFDIDDETLASVMRTVRKIAPAVRDAVGAHGVHINSNHEAAAGQVVFHLHFHIIPRHDRSEFEFWPQSDYSKGDDALIAEKIRAKIK
ncbi:MAG: Hit-like protein involved in cell-cycle regulation [Parcubacteria group bacterium Gr01-1014_49]|nr:MAG: Hit-like protein involved in cell-cycle regulation [Parcubacteria group bacterium Gr01-1014_49]